MDKRILWKFGRRQKGVFLEKNFGKMPSCVEKRRDGTHLWSPLCLPPRKVKKGGDGGERNSLTSTEEN
jgi:hypothetical protein